MGEKKSLSKWGGGDIMRIAEVDSYVYWVFYGECGSFCAQFPDDLSAEKFRDKEGGAIVVIDHEGREMGHY